MRFMNRRTALKSIALGTSSLAALANAQTAPAAVKVAELAKFAKEWDVVEFKWDGTPSLAVRVPQPDKKALDDKSVIEAGKGVFLRSYTLSCTHNGCPVALPNAERVLDCPCHGSQFNAVDGSVKAGPARRALKGLRLEVRGADVFAVAEA
jgi:Rieske Fe-S protein